MTSTEKRNRLAKIERLERKIKSAVAEIEKEEEVKIEFKGGRYDSVSYTPKFVITEVSQSKEVQELHTRKNYNLSIRYGFNGNIVGMTFNGVTITGFATRNRKYPVLYTKGGGKYKASAAQIKRMIPAKAITRYNNLKELLED